MIRINSLVKRFGAILAVDGVSFQVEAGQVLGFLGPNGAGKSTTMKMVTGFLTPTSGTAQVCGHDVAENPIAVQERIGYLPEGAPAYPEMTPESFLRFIAEVRGYRGAERRRRVESAAQIVSLGGVMRQPIDTLSKGYKRRVGLAQAILHDPDVLIMDEPTDGLDPNQKHHVRGLIREMADRGREEGRGGKAIVLSTHILEEVEAVCTRALIIAKGRIVADGTPAQLLARSRYHNAVALTVRGDAGKVEAELSRVKGVDCVEQTGRCDGSVSVLAIAKGGRNIVEDVGQLVRAKGWSVDEMHVERGRLDEVFRSVTTGTGGER